MDAIVWIGGIAALVIGVRAYLAHRRHRKWLHETLKPGAGLRKKD